ncbi:hypothetical protein [Anabaena sp. UHCC 0204]|uniref:hypothetical protein n=1 Tax=Anabaena sp. UHCC 0204 TaxID=2590009 RepID=UPI0014455B1E|nr:hypothetical protein [Anabaena sp. UHCC 0204]MTJ09505.1 hypothetical protein [Anabaena sp. UHCC 0204]
MEIDVIYHVFHYLKFSTLEHKKYFFNSLDIFSSDYFYKDKKIFLEIDVVIDYLGLETIKQ